MDSVPLDVPVAGMIKAHKWHGKKGEYRGKGLGTSAVALLNALLALVPRVAVPSTDGTGAGVHPAHSSPVSTSIFRRASVIPGPTSRSGIG